MGGIKSNAPTDGELLEIIMDDLEKDEGYVYTASGTDDELQEVQTIDLEEAKPVGSSDPGHKKLRAKRKQERQNKKINRNKQKRKKNKRG